MITARPRVGPRGRGAVALLVLGVLMAGLPGTAAASGPPTIALRAPTSKVTLYRTGNRVWLDLGVLVTAPAGDFEIRVGRNRYDEPLSAAQVDSSTGEVLRPIPDEYVTGWQGLDRFLRVEFRDRQGNLVAKKALNWCPNSWAPQRIDDSGPALPTYPSMCDSGFPYLRGMVWGIDSGWAAEATGVDLHGDLASIRNIPPGKYEVTVRIRPPYATLFDVPKAGRVVKLNATVVDGSPWEGHLAMGDASPDDEGPAPAMSMDEAPTMAVPTLTNPDPSTLPDLAAIPAWNIRARGRRNGDLLEFSSTPWNAGPAPFVVEGFRRPDSDVMDAFQYFYDQDGEAVGRAPVGRFRYHAGRGHDHWHFLQFAQFDLLDKTKQHIVKSGKQGFCLVPTDPVDLRVERASLRPWEAGHGTVCGSERAVWIREVLPAGWGDTYDQNVSGQAFNITDVPNGTYFVRVTVNPLGKVHQTRSDNDVALRKIRLGGKPGARTVTVHPFQGLDG